MSALLGKLPSLKVRKESKMRRVDLFGRQNPPGQHGVGDKARAFALPLAVMALSTSCGITAPRADQIRTVPVSEVINAIKSELRSYQSIDPAAKPGPGACYDTSKGFSLVPTKAVVSLKTVAMRQSEPGGGLEAKLGVISIDAALSSSLAVTSTQDLKIELAIDSGSKKIKGEPNPDHRIAAAIANLRDELIASNHDAPCLGGENSTIKLTLAFDVVNKDVKGFSLSLAGAKFGGKETQSETVSQSLELHFKLPDHTFFMAPK
jgi:hypothetical protein